MSDVDAAEEWLDSWVAGVDARARSAVDLSRRVATLTGQARSEDGLLAVAVGSGGQLVRLDIDDDARRRSGAELSHDIMALVGRAQADLSAQVAEQVRETVGEDTETGRAVINSYAERFPEPTGEPGEDRAR
ncbi:YbaB/EbfC family nucleoid-associated protein [Actinoplanes sp. NPDC049118]|uniref:YbaB/EbfC family nucleoid-associated protein n=1 Tax=Actinoplanes sp. NPDC049118 TaxID=3155769 RepID=UPI0033FF21B5